MTYFSGKKWENSLKNTLKKRFFAPFFFGFMTLAAANGQILASRNDNGDDSARDRLLATAREYLGTPYISGGADATGMDCSGLVWRSALDGPGLQIPRTAATIAGAAERIDDGAIEPGDLLFFNTTGRLSHVGIYLGGGTFIHAASDGPRTGVIISSLSEPYWKKTYAFAGRILKQERIKIPDGPGETAPLVNPFPFAGEIGFRIDYTGGVFWDLMPGTFPLRGGMANVRLSWMKGLDVYPGIGTGLSWDSRSEALSIPVTASITVPMGFSFFLGTQLHLMVDKALDASPQFPGLIGVSWNSKPADFLGQKVRFYQNAEYSWFPDETFHGGFRFTTGLTISCDI
jgi:probable lipoprotein NlpC